MGAVRRSAARREPVDGAARVALLPVLLRRRLAWRLRDGLRHRELPHRTVREGFGEPQPARDGIGAQPRRRHDRPRTVRRGLARLPRTHRRTRAAADAPHLATFRSWIAEGHLIATPGNIIDFDRIEADIAETTKQFEVGEIAYDPWQATQLAIRLQTQGARVIEFRQTVANFSEPTKQLDALMRSGRIVHDGNPVLAWMIGNVVGHYDAKENVYPRKERPENKIDGAIALIMAIGRHMVFEEQPSLDEFLANAVMR